MTVTATEFKNNFEKYLNLIDIFITRNSRAIAKMINPQISAGDSIRGILLNVSDDINKDSLRERNMNRIIAPDIFLDVMLEHKPFTDDSAKILSLCESY